MSKTYYIGDPCYFKSYQALKAGKGDDLAGIISVKQGGSITGFYSKDYQIFSRDENKYVDVEIYEFILEGDLKEVRMPDLLAVDSGSIALDTEPFKESNYDYISHLRIYNEWGDGLYPWVLIQDGKPINGTSGFKELKKKTK